MRTSLMSLGVGLALFGVALFVVPSEQVFAIGPGGGPAQRYSCPATAPSCNGKTCPPNQVACGEEDASTCNCLM